MPTKIQTLSELEAAALLDKNGHEIPQGGPLSIPSGFKRPPTLAEQVQRLVRGSLSRQAEDEGFESFDDADDFDIPDDPLDPSSPYEEYYDPVLGRGITVMEFNANHEEYKRRFLEAETRAYRELELSAALRRPARRAQEGVQGDSPAPARKATKRAPEPEE